MNLGASILNIVKVAKIGVTTMDLTVSTLPKGLGKVKRV